MKMFVAVAACLAMLCAIPSTSASAAEYVGASKCKMCHRKAHAKWETTKHAQAFSALKGADAAKPECVGCHTTGYPGSGPVTEEMKNVQCEACHGPGSDYRKVMMKRRVSCYPPRRPAVGATTRRAPTSSRSTSRRVRRRSPIRSTSRAASNRPLPFPGAVPR